MRAAKTSCSIPPQPTTCITCTVHQYILLILILIMRRHASPQIHELIDSRDRDAGILISVAIQCGAAHELLPNLTNQMLSVCLASSRMPSASVLRPRPSHSWPLHRRPLPWPHPSLHPSLPLPLPRCRCRSRPWLPSQLRHPFPTCPWWKVIETVLASPSPLHVLALALILTHSHLHPHHSMRPVLMGINMPVHRVCWLRGLMACCLACCLAAGLAPSVVEKAVRMLRNSPGFSMSIKTFTAQ